MYVVQIRQEVEVLINLDTNLTNYMLKWVLTAVKLSILLIFIIDLDFSGLPKYLFLLHKIYIWILALSASK